MRPSRSSPHAVTPRADGQAAVELVALLPLAALLLAGAWQLALAGHAAWAADAAARAAARAAAVGGDARAAARAALPGSLRAALASATAAAGAVEVTRPRPAGPRPAASSATPPRTAHFRPQR